MQIDITTYLVAKKAPQLLSLTTGGIIKSMLYVNLEGCIPFTTITKFNT